MKIPIEIGERNFSSKKDALLHFKNILNSYSFGQSLSDEDFNDLIALLNYEPQQIVNLALNSAEFDEMQPESDENQEDDNDGSTEDIFIKDITVSKVQFNTKCFEIYYSNDTSQYISYLMIIKNQEYTPEKLFTTACRNCIHKDLMAVKKTFFDQNSVTGHVKCQETGVLSKWEELAVDHRQPHTFSIIVDRFREFHNIQVSELEFTTTKENLIVFKNQKLTQDFIAYHRDKAMLRIVRKECNSSRSAMGRVKRSTKDLVFHQNQLSLF